MATERLIDANALMAKFERIAKKSGVPHFHLDEIADEINEADAVEVVHGRWIDGVGSYSTANCSVCGWKIPYTEDYYGYLGKTNYCPNCGAKMDL